MKLIGISLFLIALVMAVNGQDQCRCRARNTSCTTSAECCTSYCRGRRCINWGEIRDERNTENPCNLTDCRSGLSCVIEEVQCKRAPCPGRAQCVQRSCN